MSRTTTHTDRPARRVEIRPADGGQDAEDFADELAAAIERGARRAGGTVRPRDPDSRTTVLRVAGADDLLDEVAGVHKVQRVPTGASARHTSTVTVAVLDAAAHDGPATVRVVVPPGDVDVDHYRAPGAGGQHRNTTDSAVRLTHRPTGLVVTSAAQRSQHQNLASAWAELERRLAQQATSRSHARRNRLRQAQTSRNATARRFVHNAQRDETVDHDTGRRWRMRDFLKGRIC